MSINETTVRHSVNSSDPGNIQRNNKQSHNLQSHDLQNVDTLYPSTNLQSQAVTPSVKTEPCSVNNLNPSTNTFIPSNLHMDNTMV